MFRVIIKRSWAVGKVVLNACSICRLAGLAMIKSEPRVDCACWVILFNSSRVLAVTVM